ncbi:hypothetical protein DUI87_33340 [Hirundo rustica rustica]|uniref:Uncharacterized protein n=1 Tax=Hirundo rustica rustica TaxID=333673 RepID=A0A3M0IN73_HIRRU|nr:hypothetical protein DUI87_33340 [Hirundo rustica rustica]
MVGGDPYCCELLLHDHARLGWWTRTAGRRSTRWDGIPPREWECSPGARGWGWQEIHQVGQDPTSGMGLAKGMFSWCLWMEIHQVEWDPTTGMFSWSPWMGLAGDPPGGTGSYLGNVLLVPVDGAGRRSTRWDGIPPREWDVLPGVVVGDPPGGTGSMGMGSALGMFSWCLWMEIHQWDGILPQE